MGKNSNVGFEPKAWDCLSDEQKNAIREWYDSEKAIFDEKIKREKDAQAAAMLFGAIPVAVLLAYLQRHDTIIRCVVDSILTYALCLLPWGLFGAAYDHFFNSDIHHKKHPWYNVALVFLVGFIVSVVLCFMLLDL